MTDAKCWINLIETGPNRGAVIRCLRKHSWLSMSEAIAVVKNPPQPVFIESGYMTYEEAKRKVIPIIQELTELGATADWDFDYGDIE